MTDPRIQRALTSATDEEIERVFNVLAEHGQPLDENSVAVMLTVLRNSPHLYALSSEMARSEKASAQDPIGATETVQPNDEIDIVEEDDDYLHEENENSSPEVGPEDDPYTDVMSGAVAANDKIVRRHSSDRFVCETTFERIREYMPWKIFARRDIEKMDLFEDPRMIKHIPWDWRTTAVGVWRAWCEQQGHGRYGTDKTLLGALALRGGLVLKKGAVEYPEDIVPTIDETDKGFDFEYWTKLMKQGDMGEVWEKVFPDEYQTVEELDAQEA